MVSPAGFYPKACWTIGIGIEKYLSMDKVRRSAGRHIVQHGEDGIYLWGMIPAPAADFDQRDHHHPLAQSTQWMFQYFNNLNLDSRSSSTHAIQQQVGAAAARSERRFIVDDFCHLTHE